MKRKQLVLSLAALLAVQTASAQLKGFGVGPYAEIAFPTGDLGKVQSTGYGAGLALDIKLPLKLGVTGSVGVLHFPGSSVVINGQNFKNVGLTALPLRVGVKYRFSVVYASLESGVAPIFKGGGSPVILAPGLGVRFLSLDLKAKYESWFREGSNVSFFGLQAALKL